MNKIAETIISMIDKGRDILDIAKYFGDIGELLKITKKYDYLHALVQTKLGGELYCSAESEDGEMIPFVLDFIITDLEQLDEDEMEYTHYNASVNLIIPELTNSKQMQDLYSWLYSYLSDLGAEVGSFNDSKLNTKRVWIYVEKINGKSFGIGIGGGVTDEKVLDIIPDNYKRD